MSESKKVYFVSLGCPKNLVDSEIMLSTLQKKNYKVAEDINDADAVVVNTCGFIEDAKKESIDKILEVSSLKAKGRIKKVVVAGCLTQRYKDQLVEDLPEADLFVGSGEFQNIDKILDNSFAGCEEKKFFYLPTYLQKESTPRLNSEPSHRAYLKISEGCKKRCAFCAIPLIRGDLQSRTIEAVVSEAQLLVAGGVKELIVISHDFTDYGWDLNKKAMSHAPKQSPKKLLQALANESGADWIRVLYLYPDGIDDEMIELIRSQKKLLNYFDMPLQHINNKVLKRMNRRMTREIIEDRIKKIRKEIPDAVIRTQFIVGYPGETEEQFEELMEFIYEYKFDRVGCFQYSVEEDTKANSLDGQVDEQTKQRRYNSLMELQQSISQKKHQSYIGKTFPVIVEGFSKETDLLLQGRYFGQAPEIDGVTYINEGEANIGDIVQVKVTESHDYDLVGQIAPN